jgi:hypothetical protein
VGRVVDGAVAHAASTALAAASANDVFIDVLIDDFVDKFPIDNFARIGVPRLAENAFSIA